MTDILNNTLKRIQTALVFLIDVISIFAAVAAVVTFGARIDPALAVSWQEVKSLLLQIAFTFLLLFFLFSPTRNVISRSYKRIFIVRFLFNLAGLLVLNTVMFIFDSPLLDRRAVILAMVLLNFLLMATLHSLLKLILTRKIKSRVLATLTAVYTTEKNAERIIGSFGSDWSRKIIGVALYDRESVGDAEKICDVDVKAGRSDFIDWVRRESVDEVFIDIDLKDEKYISDILAELELMGITVHITVPFISKSSGANEHRSFSYVNGHPTLTYALKVHDRLGLVIKRLFDIACALVGIVVSVPIILIVAIPLLIESPGPLFFAQKRIGKNGRVFKMYKLRSMCVGADDMKKQLADKNEMQGLMFKMKDDPRITRVGKFIRKTSIDELPQFINILLGDMSLVGTRPPTLDEYNQYMSHHKRRLSLKPGLTGLWQVSGRNDITDFEDVVRLDLKYIDNWNLLLDIKILFKTVAVVFARKGSE